MRLTKMPAKRAYPANMAKVGILSSSDFLGNFCEMVGNCGCMYMFP
jgi:hypothetical protein